MRIIAALDIAFEGFKAGQFTLYEEKTARNWVGAYNFPAFKDGKIVKYRFKHERPIPTQSLVFNTRRCAISGYSLSTSLNLCL